MHTGLRYRFGRFLVNNRKQLLIIVKWWDFSAFWVKLRQLINHLHLNVVLRTYLVTVEK